MAYDKKPLLIAAGLWFKKSEWAGDFHSGKWGKLPEGYKIKEGDKILIFKNKKPRSEKSPTHLLMTEDNRTQESREDYYKTKPPADDGGGFESFGDKGDPDEGAPF